MTYMLMPLDTHFDIGFGAVAESFKLASDAISSTHSELLGLNSHLPASFLYRHAIELFLKSGIIIFHRKFKLPFDQESPDSEPKVLVNGKWKRMYDVHGLKDLYSYLSSIVSSQIPYLVTNTRCSDWSFSAEFDTWITEIDATDSTSTFFRYPVTKHAENDKNKWAHKKGNFEDMISKIGEGSKPLKAFLVLGENDEITSAFQHDDELSKAMFITLKSAADYLYCFHAAMRWELTGGV